jgi:antitoxin (DNA-binding transcriptional repressor) of toxin-antitoxin stability system
MQVNIHEAKTQLSKLLEAVEARRKRTLGLAEGQVRIADDFDELPDDMAHALGMKR